MPVQISIIGYDIPTIAMNAVGSAVQPIVEPFSSRLFTIGSMHVTGGKRIGRQV